MSYKDSTAIFQDWWEHNNQWGEVRKYMVLWWQMMEHSRKFSLSKSLLDEQFYSSVSF